MQGCQLFDALALVNVCNPVCIPAAQTGDVTGCMHQNTDPYCFFMLAASQCTL